MSSTRYLAHFEAYLLAEKRVSQNTFLAYKKDIDQLMEFLDSRDADLESCNNDHLKLFIAFLKKRGLAAKSISRKISTLKLFFGYLHKNFELANVAESLIFPKLQKSLPLYLTDKEIESLFETAASDKTPRGIRNKVIIYLLYASGMRVSELVNLTIDQVYFDTGFIRLMGKGSKERIVPLPLLMLELLGRYIKDVRKTFLPVDDVQSDYLFVSAGRGLKPLTRQSIWNILKKILQYSGINKKISPHSLRHSIATHLLKNGANLRSLQMLLGHEQLSTVQIYTHMDTSHLREVYDKAHPRSKK